MYLNVHANLEADMVPKVSPHRSPDGRPFSSFVFIGDITLWSRDADVMRRVAAAFTEGAEQIEAAAAEDHAEPPDLDGEAFRGREAAGYQSEQMAAAQRLK